MKTRIMLSLPLLAIALPAAAQEVNVYSHRQPELVQPLFDAFTKETGIAVNVAFVDKGMVERLVSEGSRSGEQFDQDARDIANFLQYVGEPAALQRERYGVWVFLYLVLLTCVLYVLKHEFWRDVH